MFCVSLEEQNWGKDLEMVSFSYPEQYLDSLVSLLVVVVVVFFVWFGFLEQNSLCSSGWLEI